MHTHMCVVFLLVLSIYLYISMNELWSASLLSKCFFFLFPCSFFLSLFCLRDHRNFVFVCLFVWVMKKRSIWCAVEPDKKMNKCKAWDSGSSFHGWHCHHICLGYIQGVPGWWTHEQEGERYSCDQLLGLCRSIESMPQVSLALGMSSEDSLDVRVQEWFQGSQTFKPTWSIFMINKRLHEWVQTRCQLWVSTSREDIGVLYGMCLMFWKLPVHVHKLWRCTGDMRV